MSTVVGEHVVKRISPKLVTGDLAATTVFYTGVLQFQVVRESPQYVIFGRDGATIHFSNAADESVMEAVRGHMEIYVEVENIAALWEHVRTFKGTYHIRDLFEQPYGMTEFHIGDPNGCLVFVGQSTNRV